MKPNVLISALRESATRHAGRPAVLEDANCTTYAQLWKEVDDLAAFFAGQGMGNGRITAFCLDNSVELVALLLAVLQVNGSPLVLNAENIKEIDLAEYNFHSIIFPASEQVPDRYKDFDRISFSGFFLIINPSFRPRAISKKLPGILVTSSGSTGRSKLIVLSMKGVLNNITANAESLGITGSDITLQVLPMSYSYGLIGQLLTHFYKGAAVVFSRSKLSLLLLSSHISRYRITTLFTVPPMLRQFLALKHPGKEAGDYSSMRLVTIGGNHVEEYTVKKAMELFGCQVVKTYGLAEAGPRVCTNHINAQAAINTAGKPIRDVKVRIVNRSRREVKPGCTGRILVESPSVSAGYLNRYTPKIAAGRQVLTNDYGYMDADGNLVVLGRARQFVYVKKRKIWFSQMEAAIYNGGKVCKVLSSRNGAGCRLQVLPLSNHEITGAEINEVLSSAFGNQIGRLVDVELMSVSQIKTLK